MKPTQFTTHRPIQRQTAFSLIEILIVISLIVLLASLVIGAARKMKQSANRSHTKMILATCKAAAEAYETKFKPILHFNAYLEPDLKFDYISENNWDKTTFIKNAPNAVGTGAIDDHIERFVYKALKYKLSAKILKTLNHKQLIDSDGDGFLEVRDGFDNMLEYAAYVSHTDRYNGTYQVPNDAAGPQGDDNLPVHKNSFFGSSGIDGIWGTTDDLYSYDQK